MNIIGYFLLLSINFALYGTTTPRLVRTIMHKHEMQPIESNGKFFNDAHENSFKHMLDALKIFWATKTSFTAYDAQNERANWLKKDAPLEQSQEFSAHWIGHASFLLQANNCNILTDPVFYDLNKVFYPRKTEVGIDPEQLPKIDFILISHNHRDHLDDQSIELLKKFQPTCLVPAGTKQWFTNKGILNVIEHTWWQETTFEHNGKTIQFTFVPAVHWSGRNGIDAHTSLWGGWLINANQKTVYFAGDTGFKKETFDAIREHVTKNYKTNLDCAFLPIGPCQPRELMTHSHMDAQEAVKAAHILETKNFIPMHWGTFGLGPDTFNTPIKTLDEAWSAYNKNTQSKNMHLYTMKFGERVALDTLQPNQPASLIYNHLSILLAIK